MLKNVPLTLMSLDLQWEMKVEEAVIVSEKLSVSRSDVIVVDKAVLDGA